MVHVEQQHVCFSVQVQQRAAQQRAGGEIEGAEGFFTRQPLGLFLPLWWRQMRQVHPHQGEAAAGVDALNGLAVARGEGGAQGLVTSHHFGQRALQGLRVQRAFQMEGGGDVVGGGAGLQLVDEPQPLLGKGQQRRTRAWLGNNGGHVPPCGVPRGVDAHGKTGDCGSLEECTEGQLHLQRGAEAGDDLGGEQGVSAELEEVVVGTDTGNAEKLSPEVGQQRLGGGAWREVPGSRWLS